MSRFHFSIVAVVLVAGLLYLAAAQVNRVVFVDGSGTPFDSPGPTPPCPRCNHLFPFAHDHYRFSCPECGLDFACRLDANKRRVYSPITP